MKDFAKLYRLDDSRLTPNGPRKEIVIVVLAILIFVSGFALHALIGG